MKNKIKISVLLFSLTCLSQEKIVQTVYFDFNANQLKASQKAILCDFIQKIDSSQIQSVHIIGYCDDIGTNNYNCKLSDKRVISVEKLLLTNGLNPKKITSLEGRGEIFIKEDSVATINETRNKNRRVEVWVEKRKKAGFFLGIPRLYSDIRLPHKTGDRIYLQNIQFSSGSCVLSSTSKKILDRIAVVLLKNPYLEFEIQGHVCCTPKPYTDAIDKDSKERNLSYSRAKAVYRYLLTKKIRHSRMTFKGYGNLFPIGGKSPELDRRVELVITKC